MAEGEGVEVQNLPRALLCISYHKVSGLYICSKNEGTRTYCRKGAYL